MIVVLRLRVLFIITTILASIGIWNILPKLIQIYSHPVELSGTEFINNPIKGKIRITGNFEYLSCAKEYMTKNGTELAGSDNYYYIFIPTNADKIVYVKSSLQPIYMFLKYGNDTSIIDGIVEVISDHDYNNILMLIPPRISLNVDKKVGELIRKNIELTPMIIVLVNNYLFELGNQESKSMANLDKYVIDISYPASKNINLILLIFYCIFWLLSVILLIISILYKTNR